MSSENLKKSIIALSPYIPAYGRHALIERLLSVSEPGSGARSFDEGVAKYKDEAMALYELVEGGKYFKEILERIANSVPSDLSPEQAKQLSGFVRFTVERNEDFFDNSKYKTFLNTKSLGIGGVDTGINDPNGGTERNRNKNVGLVAVEMLDPDLGLSTRDSSSVSIFTSLIPPVEMSRCVPYLNVKLSVDAPIFSSEDGKPILDRPSILTYLYGNGTAIDKASLSNLGYSLHFAKSGDKFSAQTASMEIFTSPQTMAPPPDSPALVGEGIGRENVPRVLDRFRPLMSLKSLSLSVVPTRGFMSYKSGKMEIVLHDRSRLAEVSAFVRPGVYQGTELDIEYGWSHPEGNSDRNVFGAFLNGMRTREKYSVVNSSFSFDEVGQVNISLVIAMKGTKTLETIDISGLQSGAQKIDEILKNVATAFNSLNKNGASYAKNIFGETILDASSTTDATLSLDDTKLAEIREKLSVLSNNKSNAKESPDIRGIIDDLQKIYGENGAVADAKTSVNQAVAEKMANLTGARGYDDVFPWYERGKIDDKPELASIAVGTVSLGRIILSLVAQPIAKTNQFEEVQVIFHPMNSKASYMRNLSIAKFPIKRDEFETKMTEYLTKNPRMNPVQLFNMVSSDFLSDPSSYPYGLRELFEQKDGKFVRKESTDSNDAAAKLKQENEVLERAGITNGVLNFVKPELYSECVPYAGDPSKTILRIHIVDAACKSYDTLYQFLKSVNLDDINSFGIEDSGASTLWSSNSAAAPEIAYLESKKANLMQKIKQRILPTAQSQTKIAPNASGVEIEIKGSVIQGNTLSQTKKFISQGVPTIRYGQQGSAINSIGITSMNDPKLTTANIINMTKNESTRPDNTDRSRGLPIFISPTQCTIEMHGCPSLQHMQFFFVDLQTGTTADNMYAVNGLEHKIEPGRFTTSTTLHLVDSYGAYRNPISKIQTTTAFLSTLLESGESVKPISITVPLNPVDSSGQPLALSGIDIDTLSNGIGNLRARQNNYIVLNSQAKFQGIFYSDPTQGIDPKELSKFSSATSVVPYYLITINNLDDELYTILGSADVDKFYIFNSAPIIENKIGINKEFVEAFLATSKDKSQSYLVDDDSIRIDFTKWYDSLL